MRIVLFTDTFLPKVDGIVTVIRLLLEHLQKRGHTVMVVCPDLGPVDEYAGAQVVRVPGIPFWAYPGLKLSWPGYFTYRKVRAFKPDVGHFIHAGFTGGSGMFMMLALNTPRVVSFHIDYARLAPQFGFAWAWPVVGGLARIMFNRADLLIAPAGHMIERIREQGLRPPIEVWGRGVDTVRFHPRFRSDAMRSRLGGDEGSTLLLYVGRLSEEKRLRDLRAVLETVPNTRLALVGDGPERPDLEAYFAGLPVTFTGNLHGDDLSAAYASSDVFVFPSRMETYGLVVAEAMASGVPAVAARVGGVPEMVEDGATGFTFEVGDVTALIDGVRALTADAAVRAQMGAAARAWAEINTWDDKMDRVIGYYEQAIAIRAGKDRFGRPQSSTPRANKSLSD
ncbi:MAG: glycosyltransferase family 1 protein [Chloroflexi bacterium]|nr:glycosyltransferase family 1 protein [Chloroflexota bacterium]